MPDKNCTLNQIPSFETRFENSNPLAHLTKVTIMLETRHVPVFWRTFDYYASVLAVIYPIFFQI